MTTFSLNGRTVSVHSPDDAPLLWVIRDELRSHRNQIRLRNWHVWRLHCACGRPRHSILHYRGRRGRRRPGNDDRRARSCRASHPLQTAWLELQVPQCGYCQSGQIMQAATLLKDYPDPSDQRYQRRHGWECLPLHDLHSNSQSHQACSIKDARSDQS
jgi:isoquinoline 1-oxidoreductase subunit alpha